MRSCRKKRSPEAVVLRKTRGEIYHEDLATYSMKTLKECEECEHWAGGDIGYGRKISPSDGQKFAELAAITDRICRITHVGHEQP